MMKGEKSMKRKIALIITAAMLITGCNITSADTGTNVSVDISNIKEGIYEITKGGIYTLTGAYKGMISIDTKDNVSLILNNVSIENSTGPAIDGENCAKLIIETAQGSENTLTDGTEYNSDAKGCVFANDNIELQGSGVLNVKANYDHGIVSDDGVDIINGTININSVGDGIHANDDITLKGGNVTIISKQDGIQAEKNVNMEGGSLNVTATGEVAESTDNKFMGRGGMPFGNGERPQMNGQPPEMPKGEMPQMNGQPPEMQNGERPQMPDDFRVHRRDMTEGTTSEGSTENAAVNGKQTEDTIIEDLTETTTEYPSSKGIKADNDITIKGGSIKVNSNDHCIKSANETTIENGNIVLNSPKSKGIKAEGNLTINGGDITADTNDESIESKAIAAINGGNINITSNDDGINAGGGSGAEQMGNVADGDEHQVIINGGSINMDVRGDGIDSNGNLYINGGTVNIDGPADSGNGALDYAAEGVINGGSVMALGGAGMAQCPDAGKQNVFNITFDEVQPAKTSVVIMDSKGNSVGETVSAKEFQNMIFSSENIKEGETYTIYAGGKSVAEVTAVKGVTTYGNSGRGFGRGGNGFKGNRMPRENTTQSTTQNSTI